MTKTFPAVDKIKRVSSPNIGGKYTPRLIVMHYTATWTGKAAIRTLTDPKSKASAHFVVDRDGTITSLVPPDTVAWHAGPSKYGKYDGLNNHAIGIEIVNIGYVKALTNGNYIDPYGKVMKGADVEKLGLVGFQDERLGPGAFYQPLYPEAQLAALDQLVEVLVRVWGIEAIVTHREIDKRGWKVDPGPAFPMQRYTRLLADRQSEPEPKSRVTRVTAPLLNVRMQPNAKAKLVAAGPLEKDTIVDVISRDDSGWALVSFVGKNGRPYRGYVNADFLTK